MASPDPTGGILLRGLMGPGTVSAAVLWEGLKRVMGGQQRVEKPQELWDLMRGDSDLGSTTCHLCDLSKSQFPLYEVGTAIVPIS